MAQHPNFLPHQDLIEVLGNMPQARLGLGGLIINTDLIQLRKIDIISKTRNPNSMNKVDIIQPTPKGACECNDGSHTYCKYKAPHPSPVPLDWSSEDWDGEKAKAREQKLLVDFAPPKQAINPPVTEVTTDDITFLEIDYKDRQPRQKSSGSHGHANPTTRSGSRHLQQ